MVHIYMTMGFSGIATLPYEKYSHGENGCRFGGSATKEFPYLEVGSQMRFRSIFEASRKPFG